MSRAYTNPSARTFTLPPSSSALASNVEALVRFHASLPSYAPTPLTALPTSLARALGLRAVYIKDESARFGLPSFKLLGASWAIHRALAAKFGLPLECGIEEVVAAAKAWEAGIVLVTATDGNHGRAVGRMARLVEVRARVFVPGGGVVDSETVELIKSEGADVIVLSDGNYDDAVCRAAAEAARLGDAGVLMQDTGFDGYEEIPQWIVDGYSTLLREVDSQLNDENNTQADAIVVPVGVGSLAQAVVTHYKSSGSSIPRASIITVEPRTAACLHISLTQNEVITVQTSHTSMQGLNCGTVSSIAWPVLRGGVDASVTVGDAEVDTAVKWLRSEVGVKAGPCGAAALAGLKRAIEEGGAEEILRKEGGGVVVLLCTEGERGIRKSF